MEEHTQAQETEQTTTTQAGESAERLFTTEEVNKIVRERLERDRAKRGEGAAPEQLQKAADLKAWENRLLCKEFIMENNYNSILLETLDTSDLESFKEKAQKLSENMGARCIPTPGFSANDNVLDDSIAQAFSIENKHVPHFG